MMITKNLESSAEEKGSGKYGLCSRYWCRLNTGIFRVPGFFFRLGFTCSTAGLFLLTCFMLLLPGGCGGGGADDAQRPPLSIVDAFAELETVEMGKITVDVALRDPAPSGGTTVMISVMVNLAGGKTVNRNGEINIAEGEKTGTTTITITDPVIIRQGALTIVINATSTNPTLHAAPFTIGDEPPPPVGIPLPTRANPVELEFRQTSLASPDASDGENYRDAEFTAHYGLEAISADEAYMRGYFGQGVTIAVADDGMDITHPDLAVDGKIKAPWHIQNRDMMVREASRKNVHGTYVAMIAAGAMDNTGTFEVTVDNDAPIPTKNIHGVAPRASVMPISMEGDGNPVEAIRYASENGADVMNLSIGLSKSYYGKYAGREGVWLTVPLPYFRPLLERGLDPGARSLTQDFKRVVGILENKDIVLVWATGNDGWNSLNNTVSMCGKEYIDQDGCMLSQEIDGTRDSRVTAQEFMENFMWIHDTDNPDRTLSFKDMWKDDCGEDNCAEYNSSGEWREAPLFEHELLGKWIVVAASDEDGRISSFSNGCGAARNWCLAAPGESLTIHPDNPRGLDGTSFAAPMVSGALAVLKSRFPDMPMEVIQAILLVSAEPVGIRKENPEEPDPVYGWGRLNLGNAVTLQDAVRLPYSVPGTGGATQATSPVYHNSTMLSTSIQTYADSQYRSLRQGQCVSPYEVIRRYQNRNERPKQMINRSGV